MCLFCLTRDKRLCFFATDVSKQRKPICINLLNVVKKNQITIVRLTAACANRIEAIHLGE